MRSKYVQGHFSSSPIVLRRLGDAAPRQQRQVVIAWLVVSLKRRKPSTGEAEDLLMQCGKSRQYGLCQVV